MKSSREQVSHDEMGALLSQVKTKKEKKPDSFFGIGFDSPRAIYGTRGFSSRPTLTHHLLDQQVQTIKTVLTSIQHS
jgi:hypothetical protein